MSLGFPPARTADMLIGITMGSILAVTAGRPPFWTKTTPASILTLLFTG